MVNQALHELALPISADPCGGLSPELASNTLYQCPVVAATNDHKLGGFKVTKTGPPSVQRASRVAQTVKNLPVI